MTIMSTISKTSTQQSSLSAYHLKCVAGDKVAFLSCGFQWGVQHKAATFSHQFSQSIANVENFHIKLRQKAHQCTSRPVILQSEVD